MRVQLRVLLVLALSTTACGPTQLAVHAPGVSPTVEADSRAHVLAAAAAVFRSNGIRVSTVDQRRGVVRSDRMRVQYQWDGEPVTARLECPRSVAAESRLENGLWDVSVAAELVGSRYAPGAVVTGTAQLRESAGVSQAERDMACTLRHEFASRLEEDIQRHAEELAGVSRERPRTFD